MDKGENSILQEEKGKEMAETGEEIKVETAKMTDTRICYCCLRDVTHMAYNQKTGLCYYCEYLQPTTSTCNASEPWEGYDRVYFLASLRKKMRKIPNETTLFSI